MKLQEIFEKPIDRQIEGVIKADDLESLQIEIEEYVITNEIEKSLTTFLSSYNNYSGANGVWISGFFGSGKSHLLKMLALLLENREISGQGTLDHFLDKTQDALLKADMKKAASVPSRSILFNIDQKADTINKTEVDALLAVFVKVFNELQGYYGKQGYIAQFERDLDRRGLYDEFKDAYAEVARKPWKEGREEIILEKENVAEAYAQVSDGSQEAQANIIDAYREDYKLSIEDFAEQVNDYIQDQAPGFRLNFFVDEVGQYIADNVKLMTNLQTVAESLATKCNGQSWIVVTAQEEMSSVLGEMSKQQTHDFSKIQARFKTRMKLTSQNVDEVIQRRLLKKNSKGEPLAEQVYKEEKNNFGTLFDFADGATTYRNYRNKQHFIDSYPFVPYQFPLFQSSITQLSQHNSFEGRHSAVGERSMLGVFQEVAIAIGGKEMGELASFDLMFNGIKSTLKTQIQSAILQAENQLDNPFAVKVLKSLFLVKYVKGFNATPRNLRVLLQDSFDSDLPKLRKEIEEALDLLEQQTYIQRNGEVFEYLTDEEKDVEVEIKNTEIDSEEVAKMLEEILFTEIIQGNKVRYDETGQDFPYTKKLDDRIRNREQELTIHFVTPFSDNVDNINILKSNSLGRKELMVVLPANPRFLRDVSLHKQTEKYIRLTHNSTLNETVKNILRNKGDANHQRYSQIKEQARVLIGKARFFVAGEELELAGEEPKSLIVKGFNELVVRTFPHLKMLRGISYDQADIGGYLEFSKGTMIDADLTEAEQEVFEFIQSNKTVGTRTTMKTIEENFSKAPYGWYLAAIQCIVAILVGRGKIEIKSDANVLDNEEIERSLKNTHAFTNLILDPQATYTSGQVRQLKDFYRDFFDQPARSNEAKALANETRDQLRDLLAELGKLTALAGQYPFIESLEKPVTQLDNLLGKDYAFFLEDLPALAGSLLEMKEEVLDPIQRFMSGANKTIYDDARRLLTGEQANFGALANGRPAQLREILDSPECFKGNQMRDAKGLMDDLKKDIQQQLKKERKAATGMIEDLQEQLHATAEYAKLKKAHKKEIDLHFKEIKAGIEGQVIIPLVQNIASRFESETFTQLLSEVTSLAQEGEGEQIEFVNQRDLAVKFDKRILENEDDVDSYLQALRKAMLKAVKANKRIRF
ncbi:MAG: BREX system P-loop protein BrxC [Chloroflexi bacterium]|nr:MAG: BREX system P-loop protein BrxC [Chloroflexota bacterium]